jgi:hypothetical protein
MKADTLIRVGDKFKDTIFTTYPSEYILANVNITKENVKVIFIDIKTGARWKDCENIPRKHFEDEWTYFSIWTQFSAGLLKNSCIEKLELIS